VIQRQEHALGLTTALADISKDSEAFSFGVSDVIELVLTQAVSVGRSIFTLIIRNALPAPTVARTFARPARLA
jgi:Na+-transporting NADH:ubiquinone oxidoreductase subunit NqrE